MNIYRNINDFKTTKKTVVTTGTFDGVHLGHVKIIEKLKEVGVKNKLETVVLTFDPHPRIALFPSDKNIKLLMGLEEKTRKFEALGVDHLIVHPFDKEFSRTTVTHYVRDILIGQLGMEHLVVGHDHHFGKNREGTIENIKELEEIYGFSIHAVEALQVDSVNVSSTKIRNCLQEGDVVTANTYLGYSYAFSGRVVHGDKIGRTIGFPTANIIPINPFKTLPGHGVYAVRIEFEQLHYDGMMHIGAGKNLSQDDQRIEVHFFNFNQDIYGKTIRVTLVNKTRNNKTFDSMEALKTALELDEIHIKNIL